ncbi:Metallophos domain containing protein [Trichuris trichiura]|uniref:Serine/threonine-protein phosphatase n=1 Tax=Trichuris trichiura TaxID=36087 RepID=A0A077YWG4_TRITR|nr:Metallophos domain containing protein [Trichuris trichiura]
MAGDEPTRTPLTEANSHQMSEKQLSLIRTIVGRLIKVKRKEESPLSNIFILQVLDDVDATLLDEPTLLDVEPPVIICGDIHGDYMTLIRIFSSQGWPPVRKYLFLGDYIDRGEFNLEVIMLLLLLKLLYPSDIFLLRGNHEIAPVNRYYGFKTELMGNEYTKVLWTRFQTTFNCMPLAALIKGAIFCVHGGISHRIVTLDQIRKLRRPMSVPNDGFVLDLLWADPNTDVKGYEANELRNTSVSFCEKSIEDFLKLHSLSLIIRAHEGFEVFPGGKLITVFSCPNYSYGNAAGIVKVDEELKCSFTKFLPPSSFNDEPSEPKVKKKEQPLILKEYPF